jgi:hypothetical protein
VKLVPLADVIPVVGGSSGSTLGSGFSSFSTLTTVNVAKFQIGFAVVLIRIYNKLEAYFMTTTR